MKILILGGHGFIGHNVARQLIDLGHQVNVVDIHHQYGEYKDWEYNPVLDQRTAFIGFHSAWNVDVCNSEKLRQVFSEVGPDVVIDLATYPNAKMVKKNVVDATTNMIAATAIALDLCVEFKVQRFVLASSSMVYGDFGGNIPNETAECNPLTLYGSYKLQCERMCKIWQHEHGLEYSILRPSALYGVRDMVVRVISKMTVGAIKTGRIHVNGPDNRLDFSYVTDVAAAFVTAAVHPAAANEIFNCTRGQGRKIIEAAELIAARLPAEIITQPHDAFYPNRDTLDSDKLKTVTDWNPTISLELGVEQYLNWFVTQEFVDQF
jgi:nucleoside-diphosphate-sugar epimerase